MEERDFAKYAFLIIAVVAVVGLLVSDGGVTGFAAKKSKDTKAPPPEVKTCVDSDGGRVLEVKGTVSGEYVNGQQYRFDDVCRGAQLTEYTCKSPSAMGVGITDCPRGSQCRDGACVSLCGNGRVDPTENCGTCPADAPCGAGQVCQNNACVALCGNGVVDAGETCSSCASDVRCAQDQQCQNGACVARPFCNLNYRLNIIQTEAGERPLSVCRDEVTSVVYACSGPAVIESRTNACQGGCNQTDGACCYGRPLRTECSSPQSGSNVSFSTCLNREVRYPFACGPRETWTADGRKTLNTICSADVRGCMFCGLRACVHQSDWGPSVYYVNHTAGLDCRAGDSAFDPAC